MEEFYSRTELLIGRDGVEKLRNARVIIFGIGGVGGYVAEALARAGIYNMELVDKDTVSVTNINRQIIADRNTVDREKTEVMRDRIAAINPEAKVKVRNCFYLPETRMEFDFKDYDYVVDAVDTVTAKLDIIEQSIKAGTPVISSMGAGNKMEPSMFCVEDISNTSVCPLAKVMRKELKKRGINHLKVVYSKEVPIKPLSSDETLIDGRRQTPGSMSFVPSVAGLIMAGEVVKDILEWG